MALSSTLKRAITAEEATGWMARDGEGEGSLLARFELEVVVFGSSEDLFLVKLSPWFYTIVSKSRYNTMRQNGEKRRQEKVILGKI